MITTKGDDFGLVILRYIPPNDLVRKLLEQIRIIPKKGLHHGQKFDLILLPPMRRHLAGDEIIHYVSKPGVGLCEMCINYTLGKVLEIGVASSV
jgi:hypothetical protein